MQLKIEYKPLKDLIPYARNARTHSEEQVKQLAGSIKEFGFCNPILISTGSDIVAGHGRALAASLLGMETVPTITLGHLSDTQRRAYVLADNRLAETSGWDMEMLKAEIAELGEQDFDVSMLGFDESFDFDFNDEKKEGLTDPDDVPEVEQNVFQVKRGDIWQLGEHRLMCGDSTLKDDVDKLMNGEKADMVFTDPPYNIASDSKNMAAKVSKAMNDLKNSEWDKDFNIELALDNLEPFIENGSIYVWCSHFLFSRIMEHLKNWTKFQGWCIWSKPNPMPSLMKRHWTWNMEMCCYATIGKHTFNAPDSSHSLACWTINKKSDGTHPTQKPIELCEHVISHSSNSGHLIMDLFLGSGSTLITCEKAGRKCYGMELDEHYCSVIIKRWQDFTGKSAFKIEDHI
jgi:DNA modification methylase